MLLFILDSITMSFIDKFTIVKSNVRGYPDTAKILKYNRDLMVAQWRVEIILKRILQNTPIPKESSKEAEEDFKKTVEILYKIFENANQ